MLSGALIVEEIACMPKIKEKKKTIEEPIEIE